MSRIEELDDNSNSRTAMTGSPRTLRPSTVLLTLLLLAAIVLMVFGISVMVGLVT